MPTPRLGAPELVSGQAIPETTVDEQIRYVETGAGHFIFKSRAVAAPPGTPADGDCYLVAAAPTGAWTGQAGKIVFRINTAWAFITPIEGFTAWIDDEDVFVGFDGATWNTLAAPGAIYVPLSYLDPDGTLAANSDTKIASQKAVRTYVASKLVGMFDLRGTTDCSANPNYPAASKGDAYVVTVAGKIGGASGTSVSIGDVYFATADNAGGTQVGVGASWDQVIHSGSLSGALLAANNLSDLGSASTARINLGATTAGGNIFTLANPSAVTFLRVNADNSVSALTASAFRTAIGAGVGGGDLVSTNNLSDVASPSTALANLGGKSATPAIQSVTSAATVTPTFSNDQVNITAQAAALTLANPTGSAVDGWGLAIRIKDNGTAHAISFGTQYRALGVTLPTTTVISKTLYLGLIFNNADTKWDVVAVAQEA